MCFWYNKLYNSNEKEKKRCQKILSRLFRDANPSVTNMTTMRWSVLFPTFFSMGFVNLPKSICIGLSHSASIWHHIQKTKDRAPEINMSDCELQCWGTCGCYRPCLLSRSEGNCQHAECSILNCLGSIYHSLSGCTLRQYEAKHCHTYPAVTSCIFHGHRKRCFSLFLLMLVGGETDLFFTAWDPSLQGCPVAASPTPGL